MDRLTRKNIKVFAGNATNNGVFGSLQAENPVTTTNVEQIQSLPAWSVGWNSATMTSEKLPPLEEFQGIQYVTTYQQAYLMQEGMPEWASTVTYYKGSLAKEVTSNGFRIYCSLTNDNTNNLLSDTSNWKKVMDSSDLYAYDSAVVHLAGSETINGAKTFTSNVTQSSGSPREILKNTDCVKGTAPVDNEAMAVQFKDSSDNLLGTVQTNYNTTKEVVTELRAYKANASTDTDIAKLQIIYKANGDTYATCPTPTDTTTTSGTQIATTGWVNSANNNIVHKTGNETIGGTKTFSSDIRIANNQPVVYLIDDDATKGTNPQTQQIWAIYNQEPNNLLENGHFGLFATHLRTDGTVETFISAYKNTSSSTASERIGIAYPTTGSAYTYAPASDVNGSIVTTVNKSKGSNGYFKLGNGLIVQWGYTSTVSGNTTIELPTSFSGTNYAVSFGLNFSGNSYAPNIVSKTSATFVYQCIENRKSYWVAIGY